MPKTKIDLQSDPEIPAGRELIEHLVGAHMVAKDEEELLHMVGLSLHEVYSSSHDHSLRVMMHAVYRAQELIVRLLDFGTRQCIALDDAAPAEPEGSAADPDRYRQTRLDLWSRLRDDHL